MRHCRVAGGVLAGRRLDAGAERGKAEHALDLGRDRPGAVAFGEGDFVERGAAQAASGRQERDRLDQVGLAGAVRRRSAPPGRAPTRNLRGVIAAEIASASGGG